MKKMYKKSPTMAPSKRAMKTAKPTSIKKKTRKNAEAVRKKIQRSPMKGKR